jgi:hypothetical protein
MLQGTDGFLCPYFVHNDRDWPPNARPCAVASPCASQVYLRAEFRAAEEQDFLLGQVRHARLSLLSAFRLSSFTLYDCFITICTFKLAQACTSRSLSAVVRSRISASMLDCSFCSASMSGSSVEGSPADARQRHRPSPPSGRYGCSALR